MPKRKVSIEEQDRAREMIRQAALTAGMDSVEALDQMYRVSEQWKEAERLAPVRIADMIDNGIKQIVPTVGDIDGGGALFYPATVNSIFGTPSAGKSFLMMGVAVQEMRKGNNVIWVDFENPVAQPIAERFARIGVDTALIREHLTVYLVPGAIQVAHFEQWVTECHEKHVSLIVFDSFGEMLGRMGRNENYDHEVGQVYSSFLRPLSATGACVVMIDHLAKAGDGTSAAGSKRKGGAIDGVAHELKNVKPFYKGAPGASQITARKDRLGAFERDEILGYMDLTPAVTIDDDNGFMIVQEPLTIDLLTSSRYFDPVFASFDGDPLADPFDRTADLQAMTHVVMDVMEEFGAVQKINKRFLMSELGVHGYHPTKAELDKVIDALVAAACIRYDSDKGFVKQMRVM